MQGGTWRANAALGRQISCPPMMARQTFSKRAGDAAGRAGRGIPAWGHLVIAPKIMRPGLWSPCPHHTMSLTQATSGGRKHNTSADCCPAPELCLANRVDPASLPREENCNPSSTPITQGTDIHNQLIIAHILPSLLASGN